MKRRDFIASTALTGSAMALGISACQSKNNSLENFEKRNKHE